MLNLVAHLAAQDYLTDLVVAVLMPPAVQDHPVVASVYPVAMLAVQLQDRVAHLVYLADYYLVLIVQPIQLVQAFPDLLVVI